MKNPLENCPLGPQKLDPAEDHLTGCVEEHHAAAAHLVAHLRKIIARRLDVAFPEERRRQFQALRLIERAHEVSKRAEAQFESLIARLAGGR
jgi:hypothetical protein